MNSHDIKLILLASGKLNQFLGMLQGYATRTEPSVTHRGSQCEEDKILATLLPGDGVYVDIGAGEPVQCSNTWSFYQRGWRGLLVEPLSTYWSALLHQRPGDLLYDSAVRHYTGDTLLRVQGTVSSVLPEWDIQERSTILVPCITLGGLQGLFPDVFSKCRLCSIDVEGAEGEVLASNDWDTFRPEVFVVEYREYNPENLGADISNRWSHYLTDHGYVEHARTQLNIIYARGNA